jgi:pyruvate carboxylase
MMFTKILVANRGEIAVRICRACTELGIRTVAIYAKEDNLSLHRYKADEAYLVGEGKSPIDAYLDIQGIIDLALRHECDAIHPGYGFLSERADFATACEEVGIVFIGPSPRHLTLFGDKVTARNTAIAVDVPVVPGSNGAVDIEAARNFATNNGYPLMVKAISGGGGRGMRVVRDEHELEDAFTRASSEAQSSFGRASVYVEKLLEHPKHIEVQILGDQYGQIVHLFERDCSVQRRHQKVVEMAPSMLDRKLSQEICDTALRLMKSVGYYNAGTVEFLLDGTGRFYFIEVNPRVQVEHTVTELITGIDIVQSQIQIAAGKKLADPDIGIASQESVTYRGFAIQARVTTEDPQNQFYPDTGRIIAYRNGSGFGVRLDGGNGFQGARILPYYDSLLVKVSTWALTFAQANAKMRRVLTEFRIRGVKTNIPFLENVVRHPEFLTGTCTVNFVDEHPELLVFDRRHDRGGKLLKFIGEVTINGSEGIKPGTKKPTITFPKLPVYNWQDQPRPGTRSIFLEKGFAGLTDHLRATDRVWLTDTTMRDAHQSLLATRMRTDDLLKIAEVYAHETPQFFSLEMWGGATFDTSMRFLREDPWERLVKLREKIPNILFQMLLRGANAVGYRNYPDNVVTRFIDETAQTGIDVFRIFDSLNWLPNMQMSIERVRTNGKIAEAAICYTGDILNPKGTKFTLDYYVTLAKALERTGAQILAIKDMAGLLKPYAAYTLVKALKEHVGVPIHLHTHDTAATGVATILKAAEIGLDIADVSMSSLSGLTSQPSVNAVVAALANGPQDTGIELSKLSVFNEYYEAVRSIYAPFESGLQAGAADVYEHEMPGGQYTNLQKQAISMGLGDRFDKIKKAYREVNDLLGDIVKVTPSSKMVGDFALFLVQNHLTGQQLRACAHDFDYPASVVDYFMGYMGQPTGGFPDWLQQAVLKGRQPLHERPGLQMEPVDFVSLTKELNEKTKCVVTSRDVVSYALYPQVYLDYVKEREEYGELSALDSMTFFYGLRPGEEVYVEIVAGKTLVIKMISISQPRSDGSRVVFFELNGQPRELEIADSAQSSHEARRRKANPDDHREIAASMSGRVISVMVEEGDQVQQGQFLLVTEAMKMEVQIQAPMSGTIKMIDARIGNFVSAGDLLLTLE